MFKCCNTETLTAIIVKIAQHAEDLKQRYHNAQDIQFKDEYYDRYLRITEDTYYRFLEDFELVLNSVPDLDDRRYDP